MNLVYLGRQEVDEVIQSLETLCKLIKSFSKNKLDGEMLADQERERCADLLIDTAKRNLQKAGLGDFILGCCNEAIKLLPSKIDGYLARLDCYDVLYKREPKDEFINGMLSDLKKLLSIDPGIFKGNSKYILNKNISQFIQICEEKRRTKDFLGAIKLLEQAIGIFPKDYRFPWELCLTTHAMGDRENAAKHFQRAIALAPNNKKIREQYLSLTQPKDTKHEKTTSKTVVAPSKTSAAPDELMKTKSAIQQLEAAKEKARIAAEEKELQKKREVEAEAAAAAKEQAEEEADKKKEATREKRIKEEAAAAKLIEDARQNPKLFRRTNKILDPKPQITVPKPSAKTFSNKSYPFHDNHSWRSNPVKQFAGNTATDDKQNPPKQTSSTAVMVSLKPSSQRTWKKLAAPVSQLPILAPPLDLKSAKRETCLLFSNNDYKKIHSLSAPLCHQQNEYNVNLLLDKCQLAVQLGVHDWTLVVKNPKIIPEKLINLLQDKNFKLSRLFFVLCRSEVFEKSDWDTLSDGFQKNSKLTNNKMMEWFALHAFSSEFFSRLLKNNLFLTTLFPNLPAGIKKSLEWVQHEVDSLNKQKGRITLEEFYSLLLVAATKHLATCDATSIKTLIRENSLIDEHFSHQATSEKLSHLLTEATVKWNKFHGVFDADEKAHPMPIPSQPSAARTSSLLNAEVAINTANSTAAVASQQAPHQEAATPVASVIYYDPRLWQPVNLNGQLAWAQVLQPAPSNTPTPNLGPT